MAGCLSGCLFAYLFACLSICLSVCLSVCLLICLPVCTLVCLPAGLPACLSPVYLSACLHVCLNCSMNRLSIFILIRIDPLVISALLQPTAVACQTSIFSSKRQSLSAVLFPPFSGHAAPFLRAHACVVGFVASEILPFGRGPGQVGRAPGA
jgi:hypothetical protein